MSLPLGLVEVMNQLTAETARSASALERMANGPDATGSPPAPRAEGLSLTAPQSDPREEVIIAWGIGLGTLRADHAGITFLVDMHTLGGEPNGSMIISSETTVKDPQEFIKPPGEPRVIPGDPNPVEHIPAKSFGKALWTFPDGSTITAIGVGNSNLMFLTGADVLTMEALAMTIAGGTGRYAGARGLWTANRSVLNPPGAGSLLTASGIIRQNQLHTVRLVRGVDLGSPPSPQPASASHGPSKP